MRPVLIAAVGLTALAVIMGIGRFVFTPILPMMLHEQVIDLVGAGWLASVNYVGYLIGALACTLQPWIWRRLPGLPVFKIGQLVRLGLVVTVLATAAMALPWPGSWAINRFIAGLGTAVGFVYIAGWCLSRLAALGAGAIGGAIFAGPGIGIAVTGLAGGAMAAAGQSSGTAWLAFAGLAAVATLVVWPAFGGEGPRLASGRAPGAAPGSAPVSEPRVSGLQVSVLALAYGLAGFGYIITATFAPVIARAALPGSPWVDFFWPLFGLGTMTGALAATRLSMQQDRRRVLTACYLVQAAGILLPLVMPSLFGFVAGSLLLGLPFTVITFLSMQEAQRLKPVDTASLIGLLTALYGAGQIIGPPMTSSLVARATSVGQGFDRALAVAAVALVVGAVLTLVQMRAWPQRPATSPAVPSGG